MERERERENSMYTFFSFRFERAKHRLKMAMWSEKKEGKMSEIKNCTMMMELYRIFFGLALEIFL